MHTASAVQTAAVTIISYKPLSHLNFARYTEQYYGSYMPSSPFGSIQALGMTLYGCIFGVCIPFESLHIKQLRSGSHFPLSAQVAELGPINSSPGGQLNLMVVPSISKPL